MLEVQVSGLSKPWLASVSLSSRLMRVASSGSMVSGAFGMLRILGTPILDSSCFWFFCQVFYVLFCCLRSYLSNQAVPHSRWPADATGGIPKHWCTGTLSTPFCRENSGKIKLLRVWVAFLCDVLISSNLKTYILIPCTLERKIYLDAQFGLLYTSHQAQHTNSRCNVISSIFPVRLSRKKSSLRNSSRLCPFISCPPIS